MMGQTSPPDQKNPLRFQVGTNRLFSFQDAAPRGSARFLWTGLGFAVLVLIKLTACTLHPLAPHASAIPAHFGTELASFHPMPALGPSSMRPAIYSGGGPARVAALPGSRPVAARLHLVTPNAWHAPIPWVQLRKNPPRVEVAYGQLPRHASDDSSFHDAAKDDATFDPVPALAVLTCLVTVTLLLRRHPWSQCEAAEKSPSALSAAFVPIPAVRPVSKKPSRVGLLCMHTPSHPSNLEDGIGIGLNSMYEFQLPREDWPAGTKSHRFIKAGDPTLDENPWTGHSKTAEQYQGTRQSGTYKGSSRVTFAPPRQSLLGQETHLSHAEVRSSCFPKTLELLKSNELDCPSFGAVEVQLPFDIQVTQSNFVGKLSSVPHDITAAELDLRKRLVVTSVKGSNAKFSKIQLGDIIRAVSVGGHDDRDDPWWSEKPADILWGKAVQTEAPTVEEGMVVLDGRGVSTYDAVLLENVRRHMKQEHMMPKTVVFVIERPFQVPDEHDPDFFGGLRWPTFWRSEDVACGTESILQQATRDEATLFSRCGSEDEATRDPSPTAVEPDPRDEPVKRIFFDFDKTISRIHVFMILAGWEESSPPPYAMTDRGQISRIHELNSAGPFWSYNEEYQGIRPTNSNGERWTQAALGGVARIKVLRKLFADLKAQGIVLTIITKGYVGAVRTLLTEEGLLDNFDMVIGNVADGYGENEYDLLQQEHAKLEGHPADKLRVSKAEFVWTILQREGLAPHQAVLVEDDPNEVASVLNPGICASVFVRKQQGMMEAEFDELRRLAKVQV